MMGQIAAGPFKTAYVKKTADGWVLEVLGAPYGGQNLGKDADGEYFSPRTDFMLQPGDERPVLYYHGADETGQPTMRPEVIGKARVTRRDHQGLWFEVILDQAKGLARRIYDAALNGIARASSGALNYLVRRAEDGELLTWPIGELTLIDRTDRRRPSNELAIAYLKVAFTEANIRFPEAFVEGDEPESTARDKHIAAVLHIRN